MSNYYETLGVGVDASPEVIQRVYRQLAKAYHPDTNPDNPVGAEKLKKLSEAYETLKDPAKRRRYDRALGLGAPGASRPQSPEQDGAARRDGEGAARRRAEEESRARDEAKRRREEGRRERRAEQERRAEEERRRRDDARPAGGASGRTRMQAARERLRARKTALASAIAYFAGQELDDRVATRVGFSSDGGWMTDARCSIRGPEDDALSLGPSDEILEMLLTGTSLRPARSEGEGRRGTRDASLERRLRAHERYRAGAGPPAGDPDLLRPAGARWLAEAEGAFHAAVWAAACAAGVRVSEADLAKAVVDEERRRRRARAMNPIRRWLRTERSAGPDLAQGLGHARADLERQVRIVRREYAAQIGLLRKARHPLLDGFVEQCLLLTHAAAECVAPYLSSAEGALAGLIDERVAASVDAARSADAARRGDVRRKAQST